MVTSLFQRADGVLQQAPRSCASFEKKTDILFFFFVCMFVLFVAQPKHSECFFFSLS